MVSTCANPDCLAPFRRLTEGRLIVVDRQHRAPSSGVPVSRPEYFWLCDQCAPRLTLVIGPENLVSCVSPLECKR